ncbi:hypothetical protein NQ317_017413 [Molorchus minor]|uniref:G-protein coupled receptors family 3 profile domain-containing protein n=1 Tax=Molorchus minor TaxID=1323400 RepID=A0ABQ9JKC5_9CUCU|nr:hypothetical protein NQ317_017413 [Molorchus minor]
MIYFKLGILLGLIGTIRTDGIKQVVEIKGDVGVAILIKTCRNVSEVIPDTLQTLVSSAVSTYERVNYLKSLPLKFGLSVYETCTESDYYETIFHLYQQEEEYPLGIISSELLNQNILKFCEILNIPAQVTSKHNSYLLKATVQFLGALGWTENVTILSPDDNLVMEFYQYSKREYICIKDCLVYGMRRCSREIARQKGSYSNMGLGHTAVPGNERANGLAQYGSMGPCRGPFLGISRRYVKIVRPVRQGYWIDFKPIGLSNPSLKGIKKRDEETFLHFLGQCATLGRLKHDLFDAVELHGFLRSDCPFMLNTTHPFVFFGCKHQIEEFVKNHNFSEDANDIDALFVPLDGSIPADLPERSYIIVPPRAPASNTYTKPETILPTPLLFEAAKPILTYVKSTEDFIVNHCNETIYKVNCLRNTFNKKYHPLLLAPDVLPFSLEYNKYTRHHLCLARSLAVTLGYALVFSLLLSRCILLATVSKEIGFMSHIAGPVQAFFACLYLGNYRESKYFTIAIVLTTVVWGIWLPLYATLERDWKEPILCLGLVSTAGIFLGTIFIPRTYLITSAAARDKITSTLPSLATATSTMDIYRAHTQPIYDCVNIAAINAVAVARAGVNPSAPSSQIMQHPDLYSCPALPDEEDFDFRCDTPPNNDKVTRF